MPAERTARATRPTQRALEARLATSIDLEEITEHVGAAAAGAIDGAIDNKMANMMAKLFSETMKHLDAKFKQQEDSFKIALEHQRTDHKQAIESLQAQIQEVQSQNTTLQAQNTTLQSQSATLQE